MIHAFFARCSMIYAHMITNGLELGRRCYLVATSIWNPEEPSENIIHLGRGQLRMEGYPYGDVRVCDKHRLVAEKGGGYLDYSQTAILDFYVRRRCGIFGCSILSLE